MLTCPRCRRTPPVQADPIPVIDTTVPVRAKRRTDLLPVVITLFCLCGLLFIGLWYVTGRAPLADAVKQTADHMAVATWLRENTNSGTWEEVRWYPTVELTAMRDRNLRNRKQLIADTKKELQLAQAEMVQGATPLDRQHAKDKFTNIQNDLRKYSDALLKYESKPVRRICGIKYRIVSPFGGKVLVEQLFDVTGPEASPIKFSPDDYSPVDADYLHQHGWEYLKKPDYDPEAALLEKLRGQ